jgi:ABC-type transport system involved in multi-copper enzyme maturation permease subunit
MKSLPMSQGFSFERFKQVTYRLIHINKKKYAYAIGGTLAGLYAFWLLLGIFGSQQSLQENSTIVLAFGTVIYQIGGYVLTASIFSELQSPGSASQFLTLPATTGEKLFSGWTISYVLYTLTAFIGLSMLLLIMFFTGNILFDGEIQSLTELTRIYLNNVVLVYLVFNSIFLLGATYFKGNNFLKTAFSVFLFIVFIGLLMIVISNVVSNVAGPVMFSWSIYPLSYIEDGGIFKKLLLQLLYALPPTILFLTLSYFRLKNRQVA